MKDSNNQPLKEVTSQLLDSLRITNNSDVPDMEKAVEIGDATFAIKGDISVVGGKEKAGKTSIGLYLIATSLHEKCATTDTLGIRSVYCLGRPVVFLDTEQSRSSTKRFVQNIEKVTGQPAPSYFYAYNIRSLHRPEEKMEALMKLFEMHPDTHLWVIDGIADFVKDPNLSDISNDLIAFLMAKAEKLCTAIIVFIHENPGLSTKFRGNLGSELQRKCYGAIGIKKDRQKQIHCMESRLLRNSSDFEDIYFRFDKEKGRMVSLTGQESEDYRLDSSGEKQKRELRYKLAYQCLVGGSERIRHNEFIRRILNHAPSIEGKTFSETTAKGRLKEMLELEIIEKTGDDRYRLMTEGNDTVAEKG